ncbi:MAG TPA: hypothetical protein EYP10_12290, partial [Armatimonadetes bacterium]|nr:hypothetical protein [Armatimonadota bacterium]
FTMPAILRRGRVTIAVDTSGSSPALARVLRDRLSEWIGSEYAQLSELLLEMREELKAQIREPARRTAMVRDALNKGVLELLRAGKYDEARELLQQCVRRWSQATATPHEQEGV